MRKFRFEDLKIWQEAIELCIIFCDIADDLESKKLFRFADQCRGVAMGMCNNISESTGTNMKGEQQQLLRYSRREHFEAANISIILQKRGHITMDRKTELHERIEIQCRRISKYMASQ